MNDIIAEQRKKIMNIFDKFYELLMVYNKRWIQVFEQEEIPDEFLTGEIEEENWKGTVLKFKTWKYIPSDITENEMQELEKTIGMELPIPLKAYYTSYFHLFDWQRNFSKNSPTHRMEGIWNAYNKYMISFGYLPFTWDTQQGCLFCMKFDIDNNDCGIYKIDHDEMFDFDYHKNATQDTVDHAMKFFADDFLTYLKKITIGQIEEFIKLGL